MSWRRLMIFDDGHGRWGPLCDLRPIYDLRTGACTTKQRIERSLASPAAWLGCPPELAELAAEFHPNIPVNSRIADPGPWLAVNGRWLGAEDAGLIQSLQLGQALVTEDGHLLAACLSGVDAWKLAEQGGWRAPGAATPRRVPARLLIERPWHILDRLEKTLAGDLIATPVEKVSDGAQGQFRGAVIYGGHPVFIAPDADIMPMAIINTRQGPVVVDSKAQIGSLAVLEGPCYVGPESVVAFHSSIRPNTVIGPGCKVAGEISHSILHGFSNKAHHGYMGMGLLGEWVNLGAATNVSNLKNTYGQVRMQLEASAESEETGRTFQGPVIGDHVCTAIATKMPTGSCVMTGAMLALSGFTPKFIGRFSFCTDQRVEQFDMGRFLLIAGRKMARRGRVVSPALERRLRSLALAERAPGSESFQRV